MAGTLSRMSVTIANISARKSRVLKAAAAVFVFLLAASAGGCGFSTTGEEAVKAMSSEERTFLEEKLMKIQSGMSESKVEDILGTPDRGGPPGLGTGLSRPSWHGPGGQGSLVRVYFRNDRAYKLEWARLGSFLWQRDLEKTAGRGASPPAPPATIK